MRADETQIIPLRDLEAMCQWCKDGTVPAEYLRETLGDPMVGVNPAQPMPINISREVNENRTTT